VEIRVEVLLPPSEHVGFAAELARRIRAQTGISIDVVITPTGAMQEVQFKSRRWRDERSVQL